MAQIHKLIGYIALLDELHGALISIQPQPVHPAMIPLLGQQVSGFAIRRKRPDFAAVTMKA